MKPDDTTTAPRREALWARIFKAIAGALVLQLASRHAKSDPATPASPDGTAATTRPERVARSHRPRFRPGTVAVAAGVAAVAIGVLMSRRRAASS